MKVDLFNNNNEECVIQIEDVHQLDRRNIENNQSVTATYGA
jgi:hypothetical protein